MRIQVQELQKPFEDLTGEHNKVSEQTATGELSHAARPGSRGAVESYGGPLRSGTSSQTR